MATKEEYARWITENQDKVGTAEFNTVAKAYQEATMGFSVPERRPEIIDPTANPNPTEGMSGTQKFLAGAGKGMTDLARGVGQLTGLVDQQSIDDSRRRDAALMDTGAGLAGNITGTVAALAPHRLYSRREYLCRSYSPRGRHGASSARRYRRITFGQYSHGRRIRVCGPRRSEWPISTAATANLPRSH